MILFEHPESGRRATVDGTTWFLTVLFGPFYLAYLRAWAAMVLTLVIALPLMTLAAYLALLASASAAVALVAYFAAAGAWGLIVMPLVERTYLRRGWRIVAAQEGF